MLAAEKPAELGATGLVGSVRPQWLLAAAEVVAVVTAVA